MTLALHMLRELVADHIERLIAFMDATEPDPDFEPEWREDDPAECGIADMDGMLEQLSGRSTTAVTRQRSLLFKSNDPLGRRALWTNIGDWESFRPLDLPPLRAAAFHAFTSPEKQHDQESSAELK